MTPKPELKKYAKLFRAVANDRAGVNKLADRTCAACPDDAELCALCARFKASVGAAGVIAIADEVAPPSDKDTPDTTEDEPVHPHARHPHKHK